MNHPSAHGITSTASTDNRQQQQRPASLSELAERAMNIDWDPAREFDHYLRVVDRSCNWAKVQLKQGNLEKTFIYFGRAAMIALDKLPMHPNYNVALNEPQRHNLEREGQNALNQMDQMKPVLVNRFKEWRAVHPTLPLIPLVELDLQQRGRESDLERNRVEEASQGRHEPEERQRRDDEAHVQQQPAQRHVPLDRQERDTTSTARRAGDTPTRNSSITGYPSPRSLQHAHVHGSQTTAMMVPDPPAQVGSRQHENMKGGRRSG
ncbi:hypothetical protein P691DRAFT_686817 [Macrolepiota fuliginosa MF-IS2]|uniref:USP8 dimerisation domain-containing protein n=1 Tax=Macrolepiota fuliginosa MF-IS2 TaxID=1400762 RepID=A0A9P5WXH1_9AGAR|nr:hypothetical protein P691DRAFT_686817 [Macrolepiota fuliginosa MF-IS2]